MCGFKEKLVDFDVGLTGIYRIHNIVNNKNYIGSTNRKIGFRGRWYSHKSYLNRKVHSNEHLQNSWNKYNKKNFIFEIVEYTTIKTSFEKETYWINIYKSCQKEYGYNKAPAGGSNLGVKCSEESRAKIRKALTGRTHSEETKKKIGISNFGKKRTVESRMNISLSAKKRYLTGKHPVKGKKYTIKEKREISKRKRENKQKGIKILNIEKQNIPSINHDQYGENNKSAKLKWEDIDEIRYKYEQLGHTQTELSSEYKVSRTTIQPIVEYRTWIVKTKTKEMQNGR